MPVAGSGREQVTILNVWSSNNPGDVAITLGLISLAQSAWPNCEITLVSKCGDSDDAVKGSFSARGYRVIHYPPAVPPRQARLGRLAASAGIAGRFLCTMALPQIMIPKELFDTIVRSDVVLVNGGGYLWCPGRFAWAGLLRSTLAPCVADTLGKRVVWCGESVWDLDRFGLAVLKHLCRRQQMILRDRLSLSLVQSVVSDHGRLLCLPDTALYFPVQANERHQCDKRIAISVKNLKTDRLIKELTHCLEVVPSDVEIVVVAQVRGPSKDDDDMPTAVSIERVISQTHRCQVVDGLELGPEGLIALYSACLLVVATRVHSAVFAAIGGRPFLIFPYERHKATGIASCLGMNDMVADPGVDGDLARRLHTLLSDLPLWEDRVAHGLELVRGMRDRWVEALRGS